MVPYLVMLIAMVRLSWEGKMQVDSLQITAPNGEIVKASISMKNDGEMVQTIKDENANNNGGN